MRVFRKLTTKLFRDIITDIKAALRNLTVARFLWSSPRSLSSLFLGSDGRIDLVMEFPEVIDVGRLAIWRLKFGDCGWWSDYINNYEHQQTPLED